jgi:hypothetical protein
MPAPISHPVRTSAEDVEQRFFQAVRGYSFCVEKVRGFTVRLNYAAANHIRENKIPKRIQF